MMRARFAKARLEPLMARKERGGAKADTAPKHNTTEAIPPAAEAAHAARAQRGGRHSTRHSTPLRYPRLPKMYLK
jgi:hypothetical protein